MPEETKKNQNHAPQIFIVEDTLNDKTYERFYDVIVVSMENTFTWGEIPRLENIPALDLLSHDMLYYSCIRIPMILSLCHGELSVVRALAFPLNYISSETLCSVLMKLHINDPWMVLYQSC